VSQYFYPEQFRINDICSEWVNKGYKVTVVTGIPNYPAGKFFDGYSWFKGRKESYNGIEIIRIPLIPRGGNPLMLALNYFSYMISGYFWKMFTKVEADLVFINQLSPIMQALPGVWYAKRKKVPCYMYVQDLWPESLEIITGIKNKYAIGAISKIVDYVYSRCTRIFTTSNSFIKAIEERGVPSEKLEYWPQYAEDFYIPLEKGSHPSIPEDSAFNIVFTGNIGVAQGLDILPKAAMILKQERLSRKIRFNLVGDGRYKRELIEIVNSNQVSDMFNFIDKQPAHHIPDILAACDAAFLSLSDSPLFAVTIPAKIQSYMACGIPIIASANGETRRIISEADAGLSSPAEDVMKLVRCIIELSEKPPNELKQLGINARAYYDKNFNKNMLLRKMDSYFGNSSNFEVG
jgi:Glycosyltransferase